MTTIMTDTKGRPITASDIRSGLRINMVAGGLGMMWFALALSMPVTMFMERLGASSVAIGMVVTVQWLAMTMQVPSALLAEHLANRKRCWGIVATLHRLIWFLPPLIPVFFSGSLAGWVMLALIATSSLLANASAASWHSWMADLIPENQRNQFWARRQSVTQGAFLLAMGLGGWILDRFSGPQAAGSGFLGFSLLFTIAAVLGTADILIHMLIPEPKSPRPTLGESVWERLARPFKDKDFLWLTLAFGVWSFGLGLVGSFGFIYLRRTFDASYTHLAIFTVCGSLGTVIASPLWGKMMDHVGERTFALGILLVAPLFALQWFFLTTGTATFPVPFVGQVELPAAILQICLMSIVSGALYTGVPLSQLVLASAVTRKEGRTLAMALHWTLVGAVGALGPVVGGWVMDRCLDRSFGRTPAGMPLEGYHLLVLAHMAASWLVALPLLARTKPRHGNLPTSALAGNPFRAFGLVQSLVALGESSSWQSRARAVRRLGRRGSTHVVGELIEQLDDPSATVREEAVRALGRIGSPSAVDALLQILEDPESDLSVQVARALREARDPRSVDALMRTLESPDSEVRKESARTLGAIGDQRAVDTLLELVRTSEDLRLVTASSEALASLGEVAAIHQILPRLREARNPALRTSLAVAVADLLGAPGEFYPMLMRERRQTGSEVSDLLRAIGAGTRRAAGRSLRQEDAERLRKLAERIEEAMLANRLTAAAHTLFDLALALATLRWELSQEEEVSLTQIEQLVWRDPKFGIGLSYLNVLRQQAAELRPEQTTDLLIGIYFLFHWVAKWAAEDPQDATTG